MTAKKTAVIFSIYFFLFFLFFSFYSIVQKEYVFFAFHLSGVTASGVLFFCQWNDKEKTAHNDLTEAFHGNFSHKNLVTIDDSIRAMIGQTCRYAKAERGYESQEGEIFFKQIVDNIREVFFLTTADFSRFIYISPLFEEIWQIPREKMYQDPDHWFSVIHHSDLDRINYAVKNDLNGEHIFDEEFRILRPDGTVRWLWVRIFPVFNTQGPATRSAGIVEDITDRKEAELQLVQAREYEFEVGAKIQRTLLLDEPCISSSSIAADSLSSQRVDGDFYHFFCFDNTSMDMAIGDVMGKGISAALVSAAVKSAFLRSKLRLSVKNESKIIPNPQNIMTETHNLVVNDLFDVGSFITLYYGRYSFLIRKFDFVDCGNTPIIHYRQATDSCWIIKGANVPLGMLKSEVYQQYSIPLEPGDLLFFFSDGIPEAQNSQGEVFGMGRLLKFVRSNKDKSPGNFISSITKIIFEYSGEGLRDDVTGVCIKIGQKDGENWNLSKNTYENRIDDLNMVRNNISESFSSSPITGEDLQKMVLAGNEAFTNIVKHALSEGEHTIDVDAAWNSSWCYLRLSYWGGAFNWASYSSSFPAIDKETGYGIPIMQRAADSILYSEDQEGRQNIIIAKNFAHF
jgi:PAS domain S-box-containing protein